MSEPLESIPGFRVVSEHLGTGGQPTPAHFPTLRAAGYQSVINLAMPTSTGALPNEAELAAASGLGYAHLPVVFERPTDEDLLRFFEEMDRRAGEKVFVHCALNWRASAFTYLYRLRAGEPESVAAADMLAVWEPEGVWLELVESWRDAYALCGSEDERLACRP